MDETIKIERYAKWSNSVAFFTKESFGDPFSNPVNLEKIAELNDLDVHLFDIADGNLFWRHVFYMYPKDFEKFFNENREGYEKIYQWILDYLQENEIHTCIFFGNVIWWHMDFLNVLKKHSIACSYIVDDDVEEVANRISRPYVKYFDWAFCGSVYYKDEKTFMKDKYLEWWAKRAAFVPLWFCFDKYVPNKAPDFDNRTTDLIYVWWVYFKKVIRIMKLKKHFWDRMKIYWRGWNSSTNPIKTILLRALKWYYSVWTIDGITRELLVQEYQNAKIWINLHQEYGPTNMRTYELPANGVMQICDNAKWLAELYDIWKEVISYKEIDEAIDQIEFYLENDDERKDVARAWYERAMCNYRIDKCFQVMFEKIFRKS